LIENTEYDGWEDFAEDNPSVKDVLRTHTLKYDDMDIPPVFGCDVTGNAGIIPLFECAGIEPIDITFSGPLKWKMYLRYKYYTEMRYLKRCNDKDQNTIKGRNFRHQASRLRLKNTSNKRYGIIHHEKEDDLDDTQDAIAGLIYIIDNPDYPSLSFDIIDFQGESIFENASNSNEQLKFKNENESNINKCINKQYIPSFYNKEEFENFMENRE
jgi:hypothetical protein